MTTQQAAPETREQKKQQLAADYAANYAGNGYPNEFKAHGGLMQCNFGGLLVILSNDGEGVLSWQDWADTAIDTVLIESQIEYDNNADEEGEDVEYSPYFLRNGEKYYLGEFIRL
jgi:hypothetical protein